MSSSNTGLFPSSIREEPYPGEPENIVQNNNINNDYSPTGNLNAVSDVPANESIFTNNVSMTGESRDGFGTVELEKVTVETCDPNVYIDEDTRMCFNPSPDMNSPRDIVSPTDPDRGELSSPFSAMESDGMETGIDDASLSAPGDAVRRPTGYFGASTPYDYTTTPGASSSACDDNYESSGSKKKRRKTRRDMHPAQNPMRYHNGPTLRPSKNEPWTHDPDLSPFSPPGCPRNLNFNFGDSSSRRSSGGLPLQPAPTSKRTKTCDVTSIKTELDVNDINNDETPKTVNINSNNARRRHTHHRNSTSAADAEPDAILHKQFAKKSGQYELRIISQPELQHRARYLTEGSRGPVKDASMQGYPKIQLLGYNKGQVKLQVFVATDSGKVKPHGFYQACRVTGRNTSTCDEIEIEGTQVIEIPFKQDDMTLSVDCVGILKLRNTDVEVRTGLRNQKRNQSVRLVFRVSFPNPINGNLGSIITLQVASSRISCTQPLGQPEISKKSLDRCSVEGGTDMFIIGKNFHRGTKVIYQDPEEADGTQWSAEGEVDKDTFHMSHMVVKIPAYHDQNIVKPVNVQLLVEFQDKKCEPHSFTYIPKQREPDPIKEDATKPLQTSENLENVLSIRLRDGPIDKKFLVELFSKLITGTQDNEATDSIKVENPIQTTATVLPPTQSQQGVTQLQSCLRVVNTNQLNSAPTIVNAASSAIPTSNPATHLDFIQPNAPGTHFTNNINPLTNFANFLGTASPENLKTPSLNVNVNSLGANSNIKNEHYGYDLLPGPVFMTAQQSQTLNQSTPTASVSPVVQILQPNVTFVQAPQTVLPSTIVALTCSEQNTVPQTFTSPVSASFGNLPTTNLSTQGNFGALQPSQDIFGGQHLAIHTTPIMTPPQQVPKQVIPESNFVVSPGQHNLFGGLPAIQQSSVSFINQPLSTSTQNTVSDDSPPQVIASMPNTVQNSAFGPGQVVFQAIPQHPFSASFELQKPEAFVKNQSMENNNVIEIDTTMQEAFVESGYQILDQQPVSTGFTKIEHFPADIQQQSTISQSTQPFAVNFQPALPLTQPTFTVPVQQLPVGDQQQASQQQTIFNFKANDPQFPNNTEQINNIQQQSIPLQQQQQQQRQPIQIMNVIGETTTHEILEEQRMQMHIDPYVAPMQTSVASVQQFIAQPMMTMDKAQPMEDIHHGRNQIIVSPVQQGTVQQSFQTTNMVQMPSTEFLVSQATHTPASIGVHFTTAPQNFQISPEPVINKTMIPVSNSMAATTNIVQMSDSNFHVVQPLHPPVSIGAQFTALSQSFQISPQPVDLKTVQAVTSMAGDTTITQQLATPIFQVTQQSQSSAPTVVQYTTPSHNFQISPQPVDVKMVPIASSMTVENYTQQNEANQRNIITSNKPVQIFQQATLSPLQQTQNFPTATIQLSSEMLTNQAPQDVPQQVYQQTQSQQQSAMTTMPNSLPMHSDFNHSVVINNVAMTMTPSNIATANPVLQQQQQQQQGSSTNVTPNAGLDAPDSFVMRQLLQSIDGSENLAAISGEDVRRQFQ